MRADVVADAGPYAPMPLNPVPAWVNAGEALPGGADAVLPGDAVTVNGGMAEAHTSATAGDGVLTAGADASADQLLRPAGAQLRAADVAALQAIGVSRVMVREPRVRVVSVGADPVALAQIATATLHTIAVRSRVGVPRQQLVVLAAAAIDLICGTKKS